MIGAEPRQPQRSLFDGDAALPPGANPIWEVVASAISYAPPPTATGVRLADLPRLWRDGVFALL
jgi:hypothetical protein